MAKMVVAEYASNVDNHRMLMGDVCDIKDLSGAYDWDEVSDIYENGKYAEKSDGSFRTLEGFASASGKNHVLTMHSTGQTALGMTSCLLL